MSRVDELLEKALDASEEQTSYYVREALQVLASRDSEVVIAEFDDVDGFDGHNLPNEWEDYEVRDDGWIALSGYGDEYLVPRDHVAYVHYAGHESWLNE